MHLELICGSCDPFVGPDVQVFRLRAMFRVTIQHLLRYDRQACGNCVHLTTLVEHDVKPGVNNLESVAAVVKTVAVLKVNYLLCRQRTVLAEIFKT